MRVVFLVVAVIAEDARGGRHPGEGGEGSGNDMDGNEDLGDKGRFPITANPADRASLPQPAAELG